MTSPFARRRTPLAARPVALSAGFGANPEKQVQWTAFVGRHAGSAMPASLATVVADLAAFLLPPLLALHENRPFERHWLPGGPWQPESLPANAAGRER